MAENGTVTSTILFTDVVGSTETRIELGEVASDQLFRHHESQLGEVVAAHRGRVVKAAGDGVMAAFDAASDAVSAAVAIQQQVHHSSPGLQIRVGVASGDVSWEHGDCFGLPVVAAARLQAHASGGQILVSNVVRWLAGDRSGCRFLEFGPVHLRGLPDPVEVYEVGWDPLPALALSGSPLAVPLRGPLALAPAYQFVGRAAEWEALDAAWTAVGAGGLGIALIGGPAGAGKTRLASEFGRWCHDAGATVLFGGCDSEIALPYQPWVESLTHLLRALPPEPLGALAPELAGLLLVLPQLDRTIPGIERLPASDPETERHRLFSAVEALLAHTGRIAPVLLVLDDLHWAGVQTLALLRHLARTSDIARLLIVGTFRDTGDEITDPLASCLADLRRLEGVVRLRVGGLEQGDVEHFVAEAASQSLDQGLRRVAALLTERSGGNAFYLGELWRHLVGSGVIAWSEGRWTVPPDLSGVGVPESVKEVVQGRLAHLSPVSRTVLGLASAAGQRIELRVLMLAAALPDDTAVASVDELAISLDELVAAGVLAEMGEVRTTYQFAHMLVRDAVEDSVAPMARVRLHLRIAQALEQVHEADRRPALAELARQFALAAPLCGPAKGVYYCRRAAAQAMRSVAHEEAISHLETALQLVADASPERVQVLNELGDARLRTGHHIESMDTYRAAFADARDLGRGDLAARAAVGFEEAAQIPGLPGEAAAQLVADAIEMLREGEEALLPRLKASLARALSLTARRDEARAIGEEVIVEARRTGDVEVLGAALQAVSMCTDDPVVILELLGEPSDVSGRNVDTWHELWITAAHLRALVALGRLDDAVDALARLRTLSNRDRYPTWQFVGKAFEVMLELAAGRFAAAEAVAEQTREIDVGADLPLGAGGYGLQMYAIRKEQGRLAEVAPVLRLVASAQTDQPAWRPGLAALYAELDMDTEARAELDALAPDRFAAIPRDSVWPACAMFVAEVCIHLRDRERAEIIYGELLESRGRCVMAGLTMCFGPVDRFLAGLAVILERNADAHEHYRAALTIAERSGSPVWIAHVQHEWAQLLAAEGSHEEAFALGTRAHQTAMALGMQRLAAAPVPAADRRLGLAPAAPALPGGLSAREAQVLSLVAAGCSNREIGERLFISPNTAANHVRAILQKTGCSNRAEAAAYAERNQLVNGQ